MERKQIQFTRGQMAALRREARRRRVSESAIVRDAVDAWLRTGGAEARDERVRRALAVVARLRSGSGKHDIAVEHDRELAEIYAEDLRKKS